MSLNEEFIWKALQRIDINPERKVELMLELAWECYHGSSSFQGSGDSFDTALTWSATRKGPQYWEEAHTETAVLFEEVYQPTRLSMRTHSDEGITTTFASTDDGDIPWS